MELVWEAFLDRRYQCEVERTSQYTGVLKIYDTLNEKKELFSKEVTLSYGAVFGPDVDDVSVWQDTVVDFIDGPDPDR